MKYIIIKIVDFGDASNVELKLSLQREGYNLEIEKLSKLTPAKSMDEVPDDVEASDFPKNQNICFMPSDPSAWGWLVATWLVVRIGEHLVDDAYEIIKSKIVELRKKYPKSRISISDGDENSIVG